MVDIFEDLSFVKENSLDFNKINKTALGGVSGAVVERVNSGNEDALEVYIKTKAIQEVATTILKDIKELAKDEAEKYPNYDSKMLGCGFNVKNGVTRYSFEHDQEWCKIKDEIDSLKEKLKERERKMIDASKFAEVVEEGTGEIIPPAIIKSHGDSVLTITIPKS